MQLILRKKMNNIVDFISNESGINSAFLVRKQNEFGDPNMYLHIIPTEDFSNIIRNDPSILYGKLEKFQQYIYEKYNDMSLVPTKFKLRSNFPVAASGKRDIRALRSEETGFEDISYCPTVGFEKCK